MHCLAVGEDDDTKPAPSCFSDIPPTAYAAVGLHALVLGMCHYSGNPHIADVCAVTTPAPAPEVFRRFHLA